MDSYVRDQGLRLNWVSGCGVYVPLLLVWSGGGGGGSSLQFAA